MMILPIVRIITSRLDLLIMAAADQRNKSAKMAKDLVDRGYYHGRRMSSPHANSGGTTMVMNTVGSSNYQRLRKVR